VKEGSNAMDEYVVFKFALPLAAIGALAVTVGWSPTIILPAALVALIYLTSARIRQSEKGLQFKRWLNWREIPRTSMVDARCSFLPGLGYLVTKGLSISLKRVYFVLQEKSVSWPRHRTPLMLAIMTENRGSGPGATMKVGIMQASKYQVLVLACAGVVGFAMGLTQSANPLRSSAAAPPLGLYHALTEIARTVNRPLSLAVIATVIIIIQARRRFQGWGGVVGVWIASGMLGSIICQFLSR
jgi:hypothetical protein